MALEIFQEDIPTIVKVAERDNVTGYFTNEKLSSNESLSHVNAVVITRDSAKHFVEVIADESDLNLLRKHQWIPVLGFTR